MNYPSQSLRVAVCQMTSSDDVDANVQQMFSLLDDIRDPTLIDLITFPENALFLRLARGSGVRTFDLKEPCFRELQQYCQHHQTEVLIGSVPVADVDGVYNSMVHVSPHGPPRVVYKKIHLFDVDVMGAPPVRESDSFRPGREPKVLTVKGWCLGLSICYDLRFAELYSAYAKQGVHAIMVPSSFLVPTGEAHWHVLLRARAIENQAYVVAPAQGGTHKGVGGEVRQTYGHSLVVSPWGEVVAEASDGIGVFEVELDAKKIEHFHRQIPMAGHRRL